ncbi:FkbM family methyltransferase [Anabaena sp. UHCC 0451]|uniref:FkbM family methyltransferase n=1 Tax=Anabaena sp. UHCC 0451 TaxID=2055235 RepID=UPI002B1FD9C4|nr:FkbM family methyltransferase [Anabaena sp. UHCC 0451]MEA5575500.1 FkbM family methyltransferase [Anabaena sp. UHCC 0451]
MRNLLQSLVGYEVERIGRKSFAVINQQCKTDAWFSYQAQIKSIIEKYKIDLVIDVGANKGQFARNLRSLYQGEIISFEPVSSVFAELAAVSSSDPNWHIHKFALGSQNSNQTINISQQTVFSSLLKVNDYCVEHFGSGTLGMKEEVVAVRRLDTLIHEIAPDFENKRIFIKMDTQGYDQEVFNGLGNILNQVVLLQSELSLIPIYEGMPHWTESISNYEKNGFGIVGMFPVNWDSERIIEYDCLLIRI